MDSLITFLLHNSSFSFLPDFSNFSRTTFVFVYIFFGKCSKNYPDQKNLAFSNLWIRSVDFFTVLNGEFLTILFSKNFQNVAIFKNFGPSWGISIWKFWPQSATICLYNFCLKQNESFRNLFVLKMKKIQNPKKSDHPKMKNIIFWFVSLVQIKSLKFETKWKYRCDSIDNINLIWI